MIIRSGVGEVGLLPVNDFLVPGNDLILRSRLTSSYFRLPTIFQLIFDSLVQTLPESEIEKGTSGWFTSGPTVSAAAPSVGKSAADSILSFSRRL